MQRMICTCDGCGSEFTDGAPVFVLSPVVNKAHHQCGLMPGDHEAIERVKEACRGIAPRYELCLLCAAKVVRSLDGKGL